MITVRPGSRVHRLLLLLSIGGEFPAASLSLLGKKRDMRKLVHRLESVNEFRSDREGRIYITKMLQLSGRKGDRTIRLYKGALPILSELHPKALEYYIEAFRGHRFSGDDFHVWRNYRVSEALAMCGMANIEFRPYLLPSLQKESITRTVSRVTGFYIARAFKQLDVAEFNKTMFTRIVGAIFYPGGVYAVYNTRDAVMKWSGMGEFKAKQHLSELSRMNAGIDDVTSALLIGDSPSVAFRTLTESDKSRRMELRFDRIYPHVHFIPMDQNGVRLMHVLTLPNWNGKLLSALFAPEMRAPSYGFMEYDAFFEGTHIYSHLDSDIARLIRFRQALETHTERFEVLCFPWQTGFLREYLGQRVILKQIETEQVETVLGLR